MTRSLVLTFTIFLALVATATGSIVWALVAAVVTFGVALAIADIRGQT